MTSLQYNRLGYFRKDGLFNPEGSFLKKMIILPNKISKFQIEFLKVSGGLKFLDLGSL